MRMIRNVLAAVKKADETFSLIDPGDVVCIGVSGGKDSMCLLLALQRYTLYAQKDFRIVPVMLNLGFPGFDASKQIEFCQSLGLTLHVIDETVVYPVLQSHTEPGKHVPCSICSRMKKAAINVAAKSLGCNKVAFAHHRDDAVETLLMNMIHGGKVNTFEPRMRLERAEMTFIRPFIFVPEEHLVALAGEEELPIMGKICPADGFTERQFCKETLQNLYQMRPVAKTNFNSMLYDYESFQLYYNAIEYPDIEAPHLSLRPLISAEDAMDYMEFARSRNLPLPEKAHRHFLLLKDHALAGKVSFDIDNVHLIRVHSIDYDGITEEEALELFAFFQRFHSAKKNPLLFVYEGTDDHFIQQAGYQKGIPPRRDFYTRRFER